MENPCEKNRHGEEKQNQLWKFKNYKMCIKNLKNLSVSSSNLMTLEKQY